MLQGIKVAEIWVIFDKLDVIIVRRIVYIR